MWFPGLKEVLPSVLFYIPAHINVTQLIDFNTSTVDISMRT